MERWAIALLIAVTVSIGVLGQAWVSWLDHRRRVKAMELIRAELDAGRAPAPQLYDQIGTEDGSTPFSKPSAPPIVELIVCAALAVGFWTAHFARPDDSEGPAFIAVAAAMTVAAFACLVMVVLRSRRRDDDGR
jgi:hypothetical protein